MKKICVEYILPIGIFIISFLLCFKFQLEYDSEKEIILDKIIDVCSIFFGVFVGALFLFERLKNKSTLNHLKKFSFYLISFNLLIIIFSFIIMNFNKHFIIDFCSIYIDISVIIYCVYIALFNLCIFYIFRFIRMIMLLI